MKAIQFKPNKNRLLVEQFQAEQKTAGGIYLAETAQEKPQFARVIAVGDECKNNYNLHSLIEGSFDVTVVIPKYGATSLQLEGRDYLIIKEDDILGMIYENN